ncbi:MAG: GGDEF domain-containing protein, partial [Candidatus Woesearchaeota archaeon]|nr:GGDEF domain-containing protein [Candidatus Woesearchaeota archaeon]
MGISPDLPIERIVESMFRDFSVGVEERLLDLPQNVAETNKKRLMNPEDMKYDDYLKSWGAYMGQIGEITSIAKTFAESSLELDIMPQKKFIEVKRDLTKKVIDYYTECSLTKLITEEKFESKQGRTNAFKLYQLQKNIEMQGLIHIMGDVKNNLIRKLKKGNITDYLTGLYNKRYFDARLLEEVERVKRNGKGHTVSLVLLDIDDFSKFNTKYGHPIADKVLKYAGEFLSQYANKRKTDIVARYGGEEFA